MTGKKPRQFVSFDWAMKKLLRSKANFDVLEGFLSELLKDDITIEEILESGSNQEGRLDKYNRVDLLVKDGQGQRIIIEVQYEREADYFQRMLYGTSKVISETLQSGEPYAGIKKVISVNIVYFDLGQGDDYVYLGRTSFTGLHANDTLELNDYQKEMFECGVVSDLFPDYYILKINKFNDVAKDGLDEWIYFLKNEEIKGDFNARGLDAAKEKLDIMKLTDEERLAFSRYEEDLHLQASLMEFSVKRADKAEKELQETQTLLVSERERAELAQKHKEEALKKAVQAMVAAGIPREDARKQLGLD